MTAALVVRPMSRRDVPAAAEIEAIVSVQPWSMALFEGEFEVAPDSRHWFVALQSDVIIGFAGMMFVGGADEGGEAHLMNVAVTPSQQRKGIARRLCRSLFDHAAERGFDAVTLEVRLSNVGAIELYRSFGFAPVGTRKDYYVNSDGSKEDGLIMWLHDNLLRARTANGGGE